MRSTLTSFSDALRPTPTLLMPQLQACTNDRLSPRFPLPLSQAGTTPLERASMRSTLTSFSDAFRLAHPHAEGQFTFWSQRARGRPRNRGLRLDYFLLCEVSCKPRDCSLPNV
jgi:exonuclease III